MKSIFIPLLSVLVLALGLGGCEKAPLPPEDKVLFQAVEDNARAINKKDLDAAMATFHPKSPDFAGLREFLAQTFNNVELKVTVSDLKVVTASPEEARVGFTLKTDQVTKEGIVPLNIVEGVDTLRPDNGTWKILSTVQTKVTRLTKDGTESPEITPPAPEASPAPATTAPPTTAPATPEPARVPGAPAAEPAPTAPAPAEKAAQ